MTSFVKSVTFDCAAPLEVAVFQHFDHRVMGDLSDERDRLVRFGATVLSEEGRDLIVMADPEGNELCLET